MWQSIFDKKIILTLFFEFQKFGHFLRSGHANENSFSCDQTRPGADSIKLYGSVNYGFIITAKF